jgi:hypothetical protein
VIHTRPSPSKKRFPFSATAEVLAARGYLASRLGGGDLLLIARDLTEPLAFLLDWLEPRRLSTHEVGKPRGTAEPACTFDGVLAFLAPADVWEPPSCIGDAWRLLVPGGMLVICEIMEPGLDRVGRTGWRALLERVVWMGFQIVEDQPGPPGLLIAD